MGRLTTTNSDQPACLVVGAGLTGATAAWSLARQGFRVRVIEHENVVGGHIRSEWLHGVPYEPNGPHLFHTSDEEVWELASSLVDFEPYFHTSMTRVDGRVMSWPIQLAEVRDLPEWHAIERELKSLPPHPDPQNFRTWCVTLMGETLFSMFIDGYTKKQWGRDPSELSASFAPKRVELRTDGYRGLFRDPHQGWPRDGYGALVERLLKNVEVELCSYVDAGNLPSFVDRGLPVLLTCPLDSFFGERAGPLEWRGVRVVPHWFPDTRLALEAMVVNEPDRRVPYTRTVESKWVFPEQHDRVGTVVAYEFPGATAKHYPVLDADGRNVARQQAYERLAGAYETNPIFIAGRLARYLYINMDEAMRQGLDAAARIAAH